VVLAGVGPAGFEEPFETGPVAGLSAIVELAVRREAMASVTLLVIVAIIAIAGFGAEVIELTGFAAAITVVMLAWVAAAMVVAVLAGIAAATTVVVLAGAAAFSGATGAKAGVFAGSGSAASR
jgi:hypothetical protein